MTAELTSVQLGLQKEIVIMEYEFGLLYRNGQFVRLLEPGRYRFNRFDNVQVTRISRRIMSEVISGQEILTSDRIGIRLSLIAVYAVVDPVKAIHDVENYSEQLYQAIQLALRHSVTSRSIDELLEVRAALGKEIHEMVAPQMLEIGIDLKRVGVRDVILPGSVRNVFMMEVEADRQGRADLVKARHEVAAARARANTAKILTENPAIVRLQEVDALVQLAGKSGNVIMLPNLADLLTSRSISNGNGK